MRTIFSYLATFVLRKFFAKTLKRPIYNLISYLSRWWRWWRNLSSNPKHLPPSITLLPSLNYFYNCLIGLKISEDDVSTFTKTDWALKIYIQGRVYKVTTTNGPENQLTTFTLGKSFEETFPNGSKFTVKIKTSISLVDVLFSAYSILDDGH